MNPNDKMIVKVGFFFGILILISEYLYTGTILYPKPIAFILIDLMAYLFFMVGLISLIDHIVHKLFKKDVFKNINTMTKFNEKRFYLVAASMEEDIMKLTDEEFMSRAEKEGKVYSEEGFVTAFNENYVDPDGEYLRVLEPKS